MVINGQKKLMPCGKCINCRKLKAYDWSLRIKNHMAYNKDCCFLNLTYENPLSHKVNNIYSLSKRDLQLFFKRLRKHFSNKIISYFGCGEYGEITGRPHYHILLFGISMTDLKLKKQYNHLYSEIIKNKIWTYGNNEVGQVETRSIYYVTGYILKNKYNHHVMENREPEFNVMSKNLGLQMLYDNWDSYIKKYKNKESIPSYYYRIIDKIFTAETGKSSLLTNGYKKQAYRLITKHGYKNFREALIAIQDSNKQKETDYKTLGKLSKRRPL